jgi:hypothetical protein
MLRTSVQLSRCRGRALPHSVAADLAHKGGARLECRVGSVTGIRLLRHVLRLPQLVPWTGQPRRTTGLERLGFYGDTWAAPRVGLPDHATRRAAGPRYAPGRRAAGPRYASGRRAKLRTGTPGCAMRRAAVHAGPTTALPRRWTFGPTDGGRRYIPMDIEAPRPWSLQPDSCTVRWDYAWGSDSGCWSLLHTAGLDNSGRVIRLHLLGPTAIIGAGPAGGGRIKVGQPGMERVEGGDFGGARTGRDLDGGSHGKLTLRS